jgi:hypothetical protein
MLMDIWFGGEIMPETFSGVFRAMSEEFGGVAPPITICWMAINLPWLFGYQVCSAEKGADAEKACSENKAYENMKRVQFENSKFVSMLPPNIGSDLVYLKSELHYLRVVTRKGNALILYNLKDAVGELSKELGMQPHRSYWVSNRHIRRFKRKGRQGELIMSDGTSIPVSRTNIRLFKDC